MVSSKNRSEGWRRFLGLEVEEDPIAVDFLRRRYVEATQRIGRFRQHAEKMHYPQYREKFLRMAEEKSRQVARIGAKIAALGGQLPDVAELHSTEENSWQSLSMALDEENRAADLLPEQLREIESAHPDIAQFLRQIYREQESHRKEIRDMMMRSDPFAQSLA